MFLDTSKFELKLSFEQAMYVFGLALLLTLNYCRSKESATDVPGRVHHVSDKASSRVADVLNPPDPLTHKKQ